MYIFFVSDLKDIYEARKSGQIRYNFNTQREAKYVTNKHGKVKRVADININSVNEIAEELFKGTYGVADMLTLNVPIYEDKEPNFIFRDGKITIKIDTNFMDETFTVIDSVDGEHRMLGIMKACEMARDKGVELQGSFPVMITNLTIEGANNFIGRKAKGNAIGKSFAKAIMNDGFTKVADDLNKKGELQYNIALTYEEMQRKNMLTHRMVLVEAMKQIELDVSSISATLKFKKAFDRVLKVVNELLQDEEYNKFGDKYTACNTYAGYVAMADYVVKNNKDDEFLLDMFIGVNFAFETEEGKLKLKNKLANIEMIVKFFSEVCKKLDR